VPAALVLALLLLLQLALGLRVLLVQLPSLAQYWIRLCFSLISSSDCWYFWFACEACCPYFSFSF
jgi:hypothetical protein